MRVTFLLSRIGSEPIGGFKVVYEYADALAKRGHTVTVVHPALLDPHRPSLGKRMHRQLLSYAKQALHGTWRPDRWFAIAPHVRLLWVPALHPIFIPNADVCVATWWQTAERLAHFPASKGSKIYLIQSHEIWGGPEERVMATWRLPLEKIVIARWLEKIANDLGEHPHYIPNGLDFERFGLDIPIAERSPATVAMLYHDANIKGSADGLLALEKVHARHPELHAELFGVPPPPPLPSWIHYHQRPPQIELRRLYNRASIFLAPSWTEGWPLPPAEAMMSGAAIVATDIGGHREYCTDEHTALLAPPHDSTALADRITRLIEDPSLRRRIAEAGYANIRQFTWHRATDAFEAVLKNSAAKTPQGKVLIRS